MTEEERHAHIGRVVCKLGELRRCDATMRSKARELAEELETVVRELYNGPPNGTITPVTGSDAVTITCEGVPRLIRFPSPVELIQHLTEWNKLATQISTLERERSGFGVD